MSETRPYRPANAWEGMAFDDAWCCDCKRYEEACGIWMAAQVYPVADSEYPSEWVQDMDGGNPRCTAFDEAAGDE